MRLFIAVDLSGEIRKKVAELINQLKGLDVDVKFTEPKNLHFTLKFLGEVRASEGDEGVVKDIETSINKAISDIKPFRISVQVLGYFGSPSHIKTLWIDTALPGREVLVKLASQLNVSLDHIRHEDREPKPHLTIGRVKSGRNREALLSFIEQNKHVKLGEMDVKLVKLKQSVLSREGPQYTDLKVFELS
jgi:2'-5' RNA ligase